MKRMAGFTLLEVLGALVLLALLLLGVYSGIHTATHTVRVGEARIGQFDQVSSTQHFLRRELAQALAQPIAHDSQGRPLFFSGDAHKMRFVAPLPGYLGRLGPQLQQIELVSDGHGGERLEARFAILPPDGSAPRPLGDTQVLLDGIRGGGFAYRGVDRNGKPAAWRSDWPDGHRMPALVVLRLKLDDGRDWPRLDVPLRVSALAGVGVTDPLGGLRAQGVVR
ncbi:prepilin-type N-terminal cleavage/methylation domain-containing protein [Dyella sp. A6]|uniref:prepilin-type N-terminal cleavage/methylation domain-containing protein n=1 Tax=Dyella aluminiiresistens TaxID=3069105 RepID=UPI002E79EBCD|nr:prepilin-type N-terminal cleavage/methylation domain-containing protein [Dyella sp. A6]